ncbi:unnamed protein product, partial [Rotaria sp. Silwood2]
NNNYLSLLKILDRFSLQDFISIESYWIDINNSINKILFKNEINTLLGISKIAYNSFSKFTIQQIFWTFVVTCDVQCITSTGLQISSFRGSIYCGYKFQLTWTDAQCCYDEQGKFIEHGKESAGILDDISPYANNWFEKRLSIFDHFFSDFLSYWSCCRSSFLSEEMCNYLL